MNTNTVMLSKDRFQRKNKVRNYQCPRCQFKGLAEAYLGEIICEWCGEGFVVTTLALGFPGHCVQEGRLTR